VQPRRGLHLLVEKSGFHTARLGPIFLSRDGATLALQARLEPALELEVVVEGGDPMALAFSNVTAHWKGEDALLPDDREVEAERVTDASDPARMGYRFTRLRPGPWSIELRRLFGSDGDGLLARAEVTLDADGNAPIVLRP
jgi:hypothetical protein